MDLIYLTKVMFPCCWNLATFLDSTDYMYLYYTGNNPGGPTQSTTDPMEKNFEI